MSNKTSAPQDRRRSLAELDRRIAKAEEERARCLAAVRAKPADSKAAHWADLAMHSADERLRMLRQSRATLLAGEEPPD
jgi:uncharacterized small protein (DUF1192 family)